MGSPSDSPLLDSLTVEMGRPGEYIRKELLQLGAGSGRMTGGGHFDFAGNKVIGPAVISNYAHRRPRQMVLTVQKLGEAAKAFTVAPT